MQRLQAKFLSEGATVAGVLSGTSADGIDVVVARMLARATSQGIELDPPATIAFAVEPFPGEVRARLRGVLDGAPCGLRDSTLLSRDLGRAFGRAARAVADRAHVALDLVGSHGQTVWHHDGAEASGAATLQLGDGDFVAEETGCTVVSDFRQRDIAAGGEGAPISGLADDWVFARAPRPCAILNLGGMGNLTILGREPGEVIAFDTGPANSLLDGLARRLLDAPCDLDGASAARGRVDEGLVRDLLEHPFFARAPPKSTGRDTFGEAWVESVVARAHGLSAARGREDLFATATAFVAETVALALARFVPAAESSGSGSLVLAGGGAHNRSLVDALARRSGRRVALSSAFGVDPDAREALVFACLAARNILGIPVTRSSATGAAPGRCLGKISRGTR